MYVIGSQPVCDLKCRQNYSQGRGGGIPKLDLTDGMCHSTGCHCCSKNYPTGYPFLTKIMRHGITIDKKIMRQGIMWKEIFQNTLATVARVYFGKIFMRFMRLGSERKEIFHTPQSLP